MSMSPDVDPYFMALVEMFQTSAFTALGKLVDPMSGETHRNLEGARFSIDLLEMLERKTMGNLADAERKHLVAVIDTLRLNYVEEAKAEKAAPKPYDAGASEAAPSSTPPGDHTEPVEGGRWPDEEYKAKPGATPPEASPS